MTHQPPAADTVRPDERGDTSRPSGEESTDTLRERYQELLVELRVVLPGVQVLFAFLITAPFSGRFGELDHVQRGAYGASLAASTTALVLLITPVALHHLGDRTDRGRRIAVAVRLKICGLVLLGVSIATALFAVTSFVYHHTAGLVASVIFVAGSVTLWFAFPVAQRDGH